MSKGCVGTDVTAPPARPRYGYHPLGMFLVGWIVTGVLTLGVLRVTGMVPRVEPALTAAPAPSRPATRPADRYSATAKFVHSQAPAGSNDGNAPNPAAREAKLRDELAGPHVLAALPETLKLLDEAQRDENGRLTPVGRTVKQLIVAKLMSGITVGRQGDLVSVTATHDDPETARKIANVLVTSYINRASDRIARRLAADSKSVTGLITECRSRLGELLEARGDIETKHADAISGDQKKLTDRIGILSARILALQVRHTAARANLAILKGKLKPPPQPARKPNPERVKLARQLAATEKKLKAERKGKTDRHPTVIALQAKIDSLTKRLGQTPKEVVVPVPVESEAARLALLGQIAAAEAELAAAARDKEQLDKRREPLTKLLGDSASIRRRHGEIVESIKTEREKLDTLRKRHAAIQMDQAAEVAKRRTRLNAAQGAEKPSQPDPPPPVVKSAQSPVDKAVRAHRAEPDHTLHVMLAIAAAAGGVGGLILASLAMWLNRLMRSTAAPSS